MKWPRFAPRHRFGVMFYEDKVFGWLTLLNMLRLLLLFAAIDVVIYTAQLITINDAAHHRQMQIEQLRGTICILINSFPDHLTNKALVDLAQEYSCGGSS